MRAVRDAGRVVRDRAGTDAATRGEVSVAVEDDLVAARGAVRVGAGDRLGVEVDRARDEAADERAPGGEGAVPRRGEVYEAHARLKAADGEGERIDAAVPA